MLDKHEDLLSVALRIRPIQGAENEQVTQGEAANQPSANGSRKQTFEKVA
jgi:hypothetical protein